MPVNAEVRRGPRRPSPGREEQGARELRLGQTLLRGEREAAGELWDHFAPLVRALLVRAVGTEPDIEDAMQEIFLRVFHKGRSLRDPALLRSYVVAVTVHYIRSEFRKRARRSVRIERGAHEFGGATYRVEVQDAPPRSPRSAAAAELAAMRHRLARERSRATKAEDAAEALTRLRRYRMGAWITRRNGRDNGRAP